MDTIASYQFPQPALKELRDLLGPSLGAALPGLRLTATVYKSAIGASRLSGRARQELSRLESHLRRTEAALAKLSPDATETLRHAIDWDISVERHSYVSGYDVVVEAHRACTYARAVVKRAQGRPRHSPATLLASGVVGSLSAAGLPLSKGRDGLLARVLTVVWHAVDPERSPVEVFRHLQAAVNMGLVHTPHLRALRGRPRRK